MIFIILCDAAAYREIMSAINEQKKYDAMWEALKRGSRNPKKMEE